MLQHSINMLQRAPLSPLFYISVRILFRSFHRSLHKLSYHRHYSLSHRVSSFNSYISKSNSDAKAKLSSSTVSLRLSNKEVIIVRIGSTTPREVLSSARCLPQDAVIAILNNESHDLDLPIQSGGDIIAVSSSDRRGQDAVWRSSSFLLGYALEKFFHNRSMSIILSESMLFDGRDGFYREFGFPNDKVGHRLKEQDFEKLTNIMTECSKDDTPFCRIIITKVEALTIFIDNLFLTDSIIKMASNWVHIYKYRDFVDVCDGPLINNPSIIGEIALTKLAGSYWKGEKNNVQLQRISGISFASKAEFEEWKTTQEEARQRDHRTIGIAQKLFMFHSTSPGSVFWLPHGVRLRDRLLTILREEYRTRGYEEVITPLIFQKDLWVSSGHWDNYRDDMFAVSSHDCSHSSENNSQFGLKPMNCPAHCLIFGSSRRSFKDLPLRLADFSFLHRNEISGALSGLTRLRCFSQDDAHIFCKISDISNEVTGCLDFVNFMYRPFGFEISFRLSTRPEQFMGKVHDWDIAERDLQQCLESYVAEKGLTSKCWEINLGDGAFYGPKIDIVLTDALQRRHQCATIQLDFQLPERFQLVYDDTDGSKKRPVIVHRAILGSLERFIAIICEHTGGKWPFWLNPRQFMVIPVDQPHALYAKQISKLLQKYHCFADVDLSVERLGKKIRQAQMLQFNYIVVVGDAEKSSETVSICSRSGQQMSSMSLNSFIDTVKLWSEKKDFSDPCFNN